MQPQENGRRRVIIEKVRPEVDGGRFAVKRVVGDEVVVEADVFADGHDEVVAVLRYRHEDDPQWVEHSMSPLGNDRWQRSFTVEQLGRYFYQVVGWVDRFHTWLHDLQKRADAGQKLDVDLQIGAKLIEATAARLDGVPALSNDLAELHDLAKRIGGNVASLDESARFKLAKDPRLLELMERHVDRSNATISHELTIVVDDARAGFGAWYELFPRSYGKVAGQHGTFRDVIEHLPYVSEGGFDVLYLPPIHPVGQAFRKGKNNSTTPEPDDVGSPWAIGAAEGGHKSIHPQLGSFDDFHALVAAAKQHNIELALDIAFQCSPDHPYVKEHPEWFRHRPDGTIQYAENPPKKYQDIYPFDFECEDWRALWEELKSVFLFWIDHGVRIFRVDNPHTKPFPFWEWCIGEVKKVRRDAIFLSEAFTRPKIMYRLAKLGFSQSYTYFTWRNSKEELIEYFTELSQPALMDIFRPNLWPNTPDILHAFLQTGGRPAFIIRAVLAATLGANYGIYGPAYELLEHLPREAGSEEYLHSEKYEMKRWDFNRSDSIYDTLKRLNQIRRQQPALQRLDRLTFHPIDSEHLLAYSKRTADGSNVVLTVVNLDPKHAHSAWLELPRDDIQMRGGTYEVYDLLNDRTFTWQGARAYIELNPFDMPAHVFQIRR